MRRPVHEAHARLAPPMNSDGYVEALLEMARSRHEGARRADAHPFRVPANRFALRIR